MSDSLSPQMGQLPTMYTRNGIRTLVVNPKGQSPVIKDENRPDPSINNGENTFGWDPKSNAGYADLQANLGLIKLNAQVKTQGTPYEGMLPVYRGAEEGLVGPSKWTGKASGTNYNGKPWTEDDKADWGSEAETLYGDEKETGTLRKLQKEAKEDPENAVPNKNHLGVNWSTDFEVAKHFGIGNDNNQDPAQFGPFTWGKGLVYEGYVHPDNIMMPSTIATRSKEIQEHNDSHEGSEMILDNDELARMNPKFIPESHRKFHSGSGEQEITPRPGSPVTITALHHMEPTGAPEYGRYNWDIDPVTKITRVPLSRQIEGKA